MFFFFKVHTLSLWGLTCIDGTTGVHHDLDFVFLNLMHRCREFSADKRWKKIALFDWKEYFPVDVNRKMHKNLWRKYTFC